jgi:hypothetical protein
MVIAIVIGGAIAWWGAKKVAMTAMPQMIAIYNGMGGGAAAAIAAVELLKDHGSQRAGDPLSVLIMAVAGALIGAVAFSGSVVAFGKLQELKFFRDDAKFRFDWSAEGQCWPIFGGSGAAGLGHRTEPQLQRRFDHRVLPAGAGVWRDDGAAHRRRGYAGGDLPVQCLHRVGGGAGRLSCWATRR